MKKTLFGSLGDMIKGNWVVIVLSLCVVTAGVLSWYTVKDINERLENQNFADPVTDSGTVQLDDSETQDVQTEMENVPLKEKQQTQAQEQQTVPQTETDTAVTSQTTARFVLPVDGQIFAAYSGSELVYNPTMDDWRSHNGIDVYAPQNSTVRAGADGTVTQVYSDGMLGWVVETQCGGFGVRYCGLAQDVQVKAGDTLLQGQTIGTVGQIPLESGEKSHIHLEFFTGSGYADPNEFLG